MKHRKSNKQWSVLSHSQSIGSSHDEDLIYLPRHRTHTSTLLRRIKLVQTLSPAIKVIYQFAICMDVEPLINERWLNKLDFENMEKSIVYTKNWTIGILDL